MKKIINILLTIVVILPCIIMPYDKVSAQTLGELKEELRKFKEEYEENKKGQQLTDEQISKTKKDILDANVRITDIGIEIEDLNKEIETLNEEIKVKDKEIKQLINFTQVSNGESAYLEYIFGAQDFTDFIYRFAIAEQLADYNDNLIKEYNQKIEENNKKTKELADKKIELSNKQKELEKLLITLQSSKSELEEESLTIDDEIKMREEAIILYEEMGCKDDENINYCGKNALPSNTELFRPTGAGRITSEYGYRTHPITGQAQTFHGALDLGWYYRSGGDPIYAAGNGVVISVQHKPCGNYIVYIHHKLNNGDTYTTSYWHMRSVNVQKGDVVSKDKVIGTMGGTKSEDTCSTAPHLHFMVAKGLYLIDYQSYNSYRIDPKSIINFPRNGGYWTDRYRKF